MWNMIAALLPVVTRGIGQAMSAGDRAKAEQLRAQAMAQYDIELPPLADLERELQTDTELRKVVADPGFDEAERNALGELKEYAFGNGMRQEDMAAIEKAKLEALNLESGIRGRNTQQAAARGMMGSGAYAANEEAAAQAAIDRAYKGNLDVAMKAGDRRFKALGMYGDFASRLKESDLSQKNRVAEAQDRINQFNTTSKTSLPLKYAQLQMDLARLKGGALRQGAEDSDTAADRTLNTWGDVGEGLSRGAEAVGERSDRAADRELYRERLKKLPDFGR